jgi:hypothetical protein
VIEMHFRLTCDCGKSVEFWASARIDTTEYVSVPVQPETIPEGWRYLGYGYGHTECYHPGPFPSRK